MNEPITTGYNGDKGKFVAGNPGRPVGANTLTKTVKETVLKVFNELQEDPKTSLTAFATKYPRDFYAIAARLIPTDIKADVRFTKVSLEVVRTITDANPNTPTTSTDTPSEPANGTE